MLYRNPPLVLTETRITDALGTISITDLPDPQPAHPARLHTATPLMERLWRIALFDIEKNIVVGENGRFDDFDKLRNQLKTSRYFGAGSQFGPLVYTRDISYAGLLGLNRLYPDLMRQSLRHTREVRQRQAFTVSQGYVVPQIDVPWQEQAITEKEYVETILTNSYTRRTDDVVWLWCALDLLASASQPDEWRWLYDTGKTFFHQFYDPFYDAEDGLYCGQASFVDIHFGANDKATGYPQAWSIADCVLGKALSTNCLYVQGLLAMATAANQLGLADESVAWLSRHQQLKEAIRTELRRPDGTLFYLKDRNGSLQERRDVLGSALAVITAVVTETEAVQALADYPLTDAGIPLFHPFFPEDNWYHNNSTWPFADTFFLQALEQSDGQSRTAYNAALLARTCIEDGTFHEVVDFRTKQVCGSGSQLWTAAAFVNVCLRAGLV